MLKRKFRIPKGVRLESFRLLPAPAFLVKTRENELLFNRFTIIVSRKIDKRAVVRNRIRRLISSCLEELYSELSQGNDIVLVVKRGAINKSRQDFFSMIKQVLGKL